MDTDSLPKGPAIARLGDACCGCDACASACPVGCITYHTDAEGFLRPAVDELLCIRCGRCESVCPSLTEPADATAGDSPQAYAVKSRDEALLMASSSGGAFTEFCRPVLESGGAVFGVVMDDDVRGCHFDMAEDGEGIAPMRGSKYLQADARGVYGDVLRVLRSGRRVLFSGTPCQANALRLYLGCDWPNLLVVDFVCHGVPSPWLWAEHVAYVERGAGARMRHVNFRCKEVSWKRFGLAETTADGASRFEPLYRSPYLRMFLRNYCLRPSCYECPAKKTRLADITIADFWGGERLAPDMCDEFGSSLALIRTEEGAEAFRAITDVVEFREVSYTDAIRGNKTEHSSVSRPPERDRFFKDLREIDYERVAKRYAKTLPRDRVRKAKALLMAALVRVWSVIARLRGASPITVQNNVMRYGIKYDFWNSERLVP